MLVSLIVAMDRHGLIGDSGGLPWHLPADLHRFKAITWGKPIIMGRLTHESIGKPLPGRCNIVLTQNPTFTAPGCRAVQTFAQALAAAQEYLTSTSGDEALVIGGGKVYAEALPHWDRLYLTLVDGQFHGSTYFPIHDLLRQSWQPTCAPETHPPDANNPYLFTFHILERLRDNNSTEAGLTTDTAPDCFDLASLLTQGHRTS